MRRRAGAAGLCFALVFVAHAASSEERDVAKADALFTEGRALMKSGNYETACPKLEASYRLDPAAGTGINLGDCFEKQGKVASALLAYQAARALLKPGDPRIGPVDKEIAALDKRAPRLTIKLAPGAPEGTTVRRDGREVEASKLGVPVAVNPGKVKVVVSAPGREAATFRVSLVEGKGRELEVGPGEETSAQLATGQASSTRSRGDRGNPQVEPSAPTEGYVLAGIGAVGLGVGVISGLMAADREKTASEECTGKKCDERAYESVQEGRTLNTISWVGWSVGLAGLGAGAYFLFFAGPPDGAGTAVGAAGSPNSGAVVLKGRF